MHTGRPGYSLSAPSFLYNILAHRVKDIWSDIRGVFATATSNAYSVERTKEPRVPHPRAGWALLASIPEPEKRIVELSDVSQLVTICISREFAAAHVDSRFRFSWCPNLLVVNSPGNGGNADNSLNTLDWLHERPIVILQES